MSGIRCTCGDPEVYRRTETPEGIRLVHNLCGAPISCWFCERGTEYGSGGTWAVEEHYGGRLCCSDHRGTQVHDPESSGAREPVASAEKVSESTTLTPTEDEQRRLREARLLLDSHRGRLLLVLAIRTAVEEFRKLDHPNEEDIRDLCGLEELFKAEIRGFHTRGASGG